MMTRPADPVSTPAGGRLPQMDGLRALGMMGVLYSHFVADSQILAYVSVATFFVASGYLIATDLLRDRGQPVAAVIADFYRRRALRLLPPLWAMLAVLACLDAEGIRASLPWHIAMQSDLYFALNASTQGWAPWVVAHLWALGPLAKFYLLWPIVLLVLPARAALALTVLALVSPFVLRALVVPAPGAAPGFWPMIAFRWAPIAAGVLLVMARQAGQEQLLARLSGRGAALFAGAVLVLPLAPGLTIGWSEGYAALALLALSCLTARAALGRLGPPDRILGGAVAQWLAKVSYGAFLWHLPLWWMSMQLLPEVPPRGPVTMLIMLPPSLVAGWLSWRWIERPLAARRGGAGRPFRSPGENRPE